MSKTKNVKFGNYEKLNKHGVIDENTLIEDKDIIISKILLIKENKNDNTKVIKYEDQSKIYRTHEKCYVDKNYINRNGDGYKFCKVKIRATRQPVIGDKMCIKESALILTSDGWIKFKDLNIKKTKVATMVNGKTLTYVKAVNKYKYNCDGEILHGIKNKHIKMICTDNHKVYVRPEGDENYQHLISNYAHKKTVQYMKNAFNSAVDDYDDIEVGSVAMELNLYVYYTAIVISSKWCMEKVPIDDTIANTDEFQAIRSDYYTNEKGFIPEFVWQLSSSSCQFILNILVNYKEKHIISSRNPKFCEALQRLALHANWSATITEKEQFNDKYYIVNIERHAISHLLIKIMMIHL